MKFKPEALIQIYLDGSFTEEAQEVFDALIQEDPVFAERVTNAVAQRLGQPPESLLGEVEGRLDAKADELWLRHKPSAVAQWGKTLWKVLLTATLGAGLYVGWLFFGAVLKEIWDRQGSDTPLPASTLRLNPKAASAFGPVSQEGDEEQFIPVEKNVEVGKETPGPSPDISTKDSAAEGAETLGMPHPVSQGASSMSEPEQEGNKIEVSISTPQEKRVLVKVLGPKGRLIRQLYQGPWDAGLHLVDWDGRDGMSHPVAPGDYTVVLDADGKIMSEVVSIQAGP